MYALPYFLMQRLHQAAINARRGDRTLRYLAWSAVAGIASAVMLALASAFVLLLWSVGFWWLALAMVAVLVVPVISNAAVRFVLVPAGYHRLAYHAAFYSRPGADPAAYALCAAAWASNGTAAAAWVEARREARGALGDAEVAATALLTAARGDAGAARELMRSIAMLVENHPAVREIAGEWLACDAAERAAWDELHNDAAHARWPATPLTYLLEGVAARHTHAAGAPGAAELWSRWALAPRRRRTRALVVEALAAPSEAAAPCPSGGSAEPGEPSSAGDTSGASESSDASGSSHEAPASRALGSSDGSGSSHGSPADPASGSSDGSAPVGASRASNGVTNGARTSHAAAIPAASLPHAIAAHLAFHAEPSSAAALARTVEAWDTALADATTRSWLARRALELDAPAGAVDRALADVAGTVTDDLARRAEAAALGGPPGADGPVGRGLARRLRHGRLDALEAGFARWAERRHDHTPHPPIDEWREFVALRAAYNTAVTAGGLELRRLAFPHAFAKGSSMAAWLWNKRDEYVLSYAISTWLLSEARIVGDAEAIELGHRNCALAVNTRLGQIQP